MTNPALLTPEDDAFRDGLDGECLLFWNVLGQGGPPSAPLAGVAPGRRRVHVLPASSAVDDLFPALDAVLAHPDTFLSVHISEKERGTPPKRLPKELGAKAVVTVLDSADRELVLPVAWTQQRTAKGAGTHLLKRLFVGMVRHGPVTDKQVVAAMGAQLRAFLHAATPAELHGSAPVKRLSPRLRSILRGQHWIDRQGLPSRLACFGFLPKGWSLIRALLPRRKGRAMQKAHELACWWRVGDRVVRRHGLAEKLKESYADSADEPSDAELRFVRSEGFMLPARDFEPTESTHAVPGMAADEVVSSWSKNLNLPMPPAIHTRNERLIVEKPLSAMELRQRDRPATFHICKGKLAPTKAIAHNWASPLGKRAQVTFEMKPVEVGLNRTRKWRRS